MEVSNLTRMRKRMVFRLKSDLSLNNIPFREDDDVTLEWKKFVSFHCGKWLNDFWMPVIQQLSQLQQSSNTSNTTNDPGQPSDTLISFVVQWVIHRLLEQTHSFPSVLKEILNDLFKAIKEFTQSTRSSDHKDLTEHTEHTQYLVFLNTIVLRILASWGFSLVPVPYLALFALVSKLFLQIVSEALLYLQNHKQNNSSSLPTNVKLSGSVNRRAICLFIQKLTHIPMTPFDVRRNIISKPSANRFSVSALMSPLHFQQIKKEQSSLTSQTSQTTSNSSCSSNLLPNIKIWSVHQVQEFLYDKGMYEILDTFFHHKVDGSIFLDLNEDSLKNTFGIHRVAFRKRILKLITDIKKRHKS